jgi:acyl carrier protein
MINVLIKYPYVLGTFRLRLGLSPEDRRNRRAMQSARYEMHQPHIMAQFTKLVAEVLHRDDLVLTDGMTAEDVPGWDSFTHIEVVVAVEDHFRLSLRTSEIVALNRVQDWIDLLARHLSSTVGAGLAHGP